MNIPTRYYSDSMAFFARQMQSQKFNPDCPPDLGIAHLTSVPPVPPFTEDADQSLFRHATFRTEVLSNPGVHEVRTAKDIDWPAGIGVLFGFQHAPKRLEFQDLRILKNQGLHFMALAYDDENEYGGGFKTECELTLRGKQLLEWMAETGITLDLSHAGHVTMWTALEYIRKRNLPLHVVATHSGCASVYPHPRNVPDSVLTELDYIGIPAITFFLDKRGTDYLGRFARHMEHAMRVAGKGKVGIGSDCLHIDMSMQEGHAHFRNMTKALKMDGAFREYFPDRPPKLIEHGTHMFEIIEQRLAKANLLALDPGVLGLNFREFLFRSLR